MSLYTRIYFDRQRVLFGQAVLNTSDVTHERAGSLASRRLPLQGRLHLHLKRQLRQADGPAPDALVSALCAAQDQGLRAGSPPPLFVALDGAFAFSTSATADTLGLESGAGLMTEQATILFLHELIKDNIITGRVPYTPLSPLSATGAV